MARFHGMVGYEITEEVRPGVWMPNIVLKPYYGDIVFNSRRLESQNNVIDNVVLSNKFSIVADAFAYQNFHLMRFVEYMGTKWKISNVEVQRPRLILSVGGVYNGEEQT